AVEALHIGVLRGFPRLREHQRHAVGSRPLVKRPAQAPCPAGPPLRQAQLRPHVRDGSPSRRRAQYFPRATILSASLSSIDSASSFLSRAFSASSAFRRLASGTSMPPNLRRHR